MNAKNNKSTQVLKIDHSTTIRKNFFFENKNIQLQRNFYFESIERCDANDKCANRVIIN